MNDKQSDTSEWESLGVKLKSVVNGQKKPDEVVSLGIRKPDVDSQDSDDRIWLLGQEFQIDNKISLSAKELPIASFDSYDVSMVWLGKMNPSDRDAYIIAWKNGVPEFFTGVLCCVN
jgi:hypothetical protein